MQEDYVNDYQVLRKLTVTDGDVPQLNQLIRLKVKNEDKDYWVNNEIILGCNQLDESIEKIVIGMKLGQVYEIEKKNSGKKEKLLIHLVKLGQIKASQSQQLQSEKAKEKGNAFVKQKQYYQAQKTYQQAYQLIQYHCAAQTHDLQLSLLSNLALVCLNQNKFHQTLKWCDIHLRSSQQPNKKIVYRQAMAYRGLKQWQQSRKVIKNALRKWQDVETQNDFKKMQQMVSQQQKIQKAQQKVVYAKMFG